MISGSAHFESPIKLPVPYVMNEIPFLYSPSKPRFYYFDMELFKFPERREIASISSSFSRKMAYHGYRTASLQRPWHCYIARMAFGVLVAIRCALTIL